MFIRSQFTVKTIMNTLRFRLLKSQQCQKLFFKDMFGKQQHFIINEVKLVGTSITSGELRQINYPNTTSPQTQVFQKKRLILKLELMVTGSIFNETDPSKGFSKTEKFTVDVAVDIKIKNGKDIVVLEVLENVALSALGINLMSNFEIELGLLNQVNDLWNKVTNSILQIRHIDIIFNETLNLVEIAIELDGGNVSLDDRTSFWSRFYSNNLDEFMMGAPWAMHFDQRILAAFLTNDFSNKVDSEISLVGKPNISWNSGLPGYLITVNGNFETPWGMDVGVPLFAKSKLSIINDKLCVDTWIGIEGDSIVNDLVMLILVKIFNVEVNLKSEQCRNIDKDHIRCEYDIPKFKFASCPNVSMSFRISSLNGRPDGFILVGSIDMPEIIDPVVKIELIENLKYHPPMIKCINMEGTYPGERIEARIRIFRESGNFDFRLCDVTVLGPLEQKVKIKTVEVTCPFSAWIILSIPIYYYDGEPLKVIITTTQGAYCVVIPADTIPSEDERNKLVKNSMFESINDCYLRSKEWDIRWHIDPADYINVIRVKQIWEVSGVVSEHVEKINILDEQGELVATTDVRQNKTFQFPIISPSKNIKIIQTTNESKFNREFSDDSEIRVTQTLLGVERDIRFEKNIIAIDTVNIESKRMVLIHQTDRLSLFNVSELGDFLWIGELDASELLWIGRKGSTLYAHNTNGRLFTFEIYEQKTVQWQENLKLETPVVDTKDYNKTNYGPLNQKEALNEESELKENTNLKVDFQKQRYDHILFRGNAEPPANMVALQSYKGFRITKLDNAIVFAPNDSKIMNTAICLSNPQAAILSRISRDIFLAPSKGGHTLQVLRLLARLEMCPLTTSPSR
ncbi:hypothetical protein [Bacillus toyonensis]|uniref:hypothetical protein n=1 Tax=Bacillus toyonensis TaxID=155322 RepID=UPI000BF1F410|nr:hypothetical protein [Bacillus toyonensis]PEO25783.1 hypothetical protein CN589_23145 [Bacillus toyonensis]PFY03784.1 hypothetical protein COL45_08855 [Bacillus toyonensis]PHB85861.1 hypothetical protein COE93_01360 [Bacillus toyonensis]